jgi:predicted AAA+ superfamily ATPase
LQTDWSSYSNSETAAADELLEITSNYLYKDALMFENVKSSHLIVKLLQLLAFQTGNEVSVNELATSLGIARATVERYVDILEKCFVLFRLRALSRNGRKEISKNHKIYFYDLGVRNAIIQNFNPIHMRNDAGSLWENFCIVERLKQNSFRGHIPNLYFWRTYEGQKIDYIEEYEFKYSQKAKVKTPESFLKAYPSEFSVVHKNNLFDEFIVSGD